MLLLRPGLFQAVPHLQASQEVIVPLSPTFLARVNKGTGRWMGNRRAFLFAVFTGASFTCGSVFN